MSLHVQIHTKDNYSFSRMLKELKAPQNNSNAWCSQSDRLQMAEDTLSAVRRVRREVVDGMRMLMKAAKDKKSEGNIVGVKSFTNHYTGVNNSPIIPNHSSTIIKHPSMFRVSFFLLCAMFLVERKTALRQSSIRG